MNYSLEELEREAEKILLTGKFESIDCLLQPNTVFLVHPKSGNSGILFKVKEGYHTIWYKEDIVRKTRYEDIKTIESCRYHNEINNPGKVKFIQEALEELNEKYKVKTLLTSEKNQTTYGDNGEL